MLRMRPFTSKKKSTESWGEKTTAEVACRSNVSKVVEAAADRLREDVRRLGTNERTKGVSVREALELLALHCHQ